MDDKKKSILLILLLLGAGGFLGAFLFLTDANPQKPKRISATSPEAEKLVNKHLWIAARNQELAQEKMKAQNTYLSPQIGDSIWPKGNEKAKQIGVDHSPDRYEQNAYDDLNRYRKEVQATNPDHIIQQQLVEQDRMQEYSEAYRAEYARQFVENARKNGYLVKLNSDFVVISVTELPNAGARNPSFFENGSRSQAK